MANPWNPVDPCVPSGGHFTVETDNQWVTPSNEPATRQTYWQGESFDWPAYGEPSRLCPAGAPNIWIREYITETGETANFFIKDSVTKIQDLEPTSRGFPQAKYQLPEQLYNSDNGRYSIFGGTINVTCYVEIQLNVYLATIRTMIGRTWGYDGPGKIRINFDENFVMGGGPGGWVYKGPTHQNGYGDSWGVALDRWLNGHNCTVGYEVWVGGEMKCSPNGNAM